MHLSFRNDASTTVKVISVITKRGGGGGRGAGGGVMPPQDITLLSKGVLLEPRVTISN
jgi:hypothetical protein